MFAADAVIHVNMGDVNVTWVEIVAVVTPIMAGLTGMMNKLVNCMRDRDAREAALQQKIFDMAMATAKAEERAAESVKSLAEKVK